MKEFIDILHIVGFSQGIFLGIVLFSKQENKKANFIIALLILMFSLQMVARYLLFHNIMITGWIIGLFTFPAVMLFGPLVYFYTGTMTKSIPKIKRRDAIHLIPYALFAVMFITVNLLEPPNLENFKLFRESIEAKQGIGSFVIGFAALIGLAYTIKSWIFLSGYARTIREFFSDIDRRNLIWLRYLLIVMLIFYICWNVTHWLHYFDLVPRAVFLVVLLCHVLIIYLSAFFALRQPDLFSDMTILRHELENENIENDEDDEKPKYEKHSFDEVTAMRHLHTLQEYMDNKKPYLRDSLTLKELADDIDIPSHHLSMVINHFLEQNFYIFVNSYRIEEAKLKLSDPDNRESILEIAYESGFNSKSTFNHMFKKFTAMTPTQYRQKKAV